MYALIYDNFHRKNDGKFVNCRVPYLNPPRIRLVDPTATCQAQPEIGWIKSMIVEVIVCKNIGIPLHLTCEYAPTR